MTDSNSQQNTPIEGIDPDNNVKMVTERTYFKAEKRGFAAGYEMEDWLEAELEVSNQCHNRSQQV
ncbi:DUF2934 domain-containing protein [Methylobacter svalbardensis]|uniref:DUF2934 domain-containing protein n=1 Tax=Methylobacter svalbardensis TaxID=3080016 RepID=UPI0030EB7BC8